MYRSNNKPVANPMMDNAIQQKLQYHQRVRVLYHEKRPVSKEALKKARVKFISRHKAHPQIEAVLSMSIHHPSIALPNQQQLTDLEMQDKELLQKIGLMASIDSIHLIDPNHQVGDVDENSMNSMISSVLLAAYEYCDKRNVNEWQLSVAPFFKLQLNKFGIDYQMYDREVNGKHHIGVDPFQFIHSGKPVIKLWNRRLFDFTLH